MQSVLTLIIGLLAALAAVFFIQRFMLQRAVRQVVEIFRRHDACHAAGAKTLEELGLGPKSFMTRMTTLRDYRPDAVKLLLQGDIILSTDDGKLYLREDRLSRILPKAA
ncbi:MAG: hypothetical protein A4E73_02857 [Syntrophaceae bacterium PtaU1.Bin231]|nr:MAG: hypothetical protein A4E73_02857 [Syntrophaceae bacterium PtaU1.Bin231]HOG17758.1 hypothetical protein [Syntrophales bacterium]